MNTARAWRNGDSESDAAGAPRLSDTSSLESGNHAVSVDPRVARIRAAMAPGALNIVFQPVIDLRRGVIAGAEALARFVAEPVRTPDLWFNEAWDVNLGVELELHAIRLALAAVPRLPEGSHLAINASPQTLVSPLLDAVLAQVPGHRLVVELTEHAQVDDYRDVKTAIERLRLRGIRLAIDDAGAGFSSLQHILHLRPDLIKLDRSLTQGIDSDPVRYALAAALVTFASSLDAEICAEGIEKDAELAALQHLGIAYGQGYFLGRPLPLPLTQPPRGVWLHEGAARIQAEVPGGRSLRPAAQRDRVVPLYGADLLDAAPVEAFDRVTRWASALLRVPIAFFSFVHQRREVMRSSVGFPGTVMACRQSSAAPSLCEHVVAANSPLVIPDARQHPIALQTRTVGELGAGAYLGVPVRGPGGESFGALCVVDRDRHAWTLEDERTLVGLAATLVSELELRAIRRATRPGTH